MREGKWVERNSRSSNLGEVTKKERGEERGRAEHRQKRTDRLIETVQSMLRSNSMSGCFQQFFESINPKSDFDDDNDALETYLYNKSLKIQPKDAEKPAKDVKPRHPPHVLKSPGIKSPHAKPTLSNHYSSSGAGSVFSTSQSHVHPSVNASSYGSHPGPIPSPPAFPAPLSPADAAAAAAAAHSLSSHSDRPPGKEPQHFTFSDGASSLSRRHNKIPALQPPPLHPRPPRPTPTTSSYPLTLPSASPLSKPPSQRRPPPPIPMAAGSVSGSPIAKSKSPAGAMTGSSASTPGDMPQSAFVFPNVDSSAIPPLPPRPNNRQQTPTEQDQLRVTLDSRSSSESHSPTVCLSVPLPPPLHPRGAFSNQAPPPLPPKTRYSSSADNSPLLPVKTCSITPGSATPSSNSASPTATSPAPLPAASTQPPALPPKTYKTRKASGSPSESSNR
ncbi:hypothetical protein WR25_16447 [Diploscapter pachys]|uniref:Uncharacterized protein n=1 Tax=Diploscapter pachys TaxID=2018661 RepID=A0A2A2KIQ4_9BILA|nr:hypothetical protein WR25_16447 [Diploscapter pachys]